MLSQSFIGALVKIVLLDFRESLVLKELILQTLEQGRRRTELQTQKSLLPYTHWDIILNLYSQSSYLFLTMGSLPLGLSIPLPNIAW